MPDTKKFSSTDGKARPTAATSHPLVRQQSLMITGKLRTSMPGRQRHSAATVVQPTSETDTSHTRSALLLCCVDSVLDEVACRICCQLGCMESCLLRQYLEGESLQQRRVFRKARGRGGGGAQWGAGGRKSQAGKGLASIVTSPASNAEPNVRQQEHAH